MVVKEVTVKNSKEFPQQESIGMIINVLILSVAIFLVSQILPGVRIKGYLTAVVVAVVYSVINFFFGWLFTLLTLPLVIITFGLFKLVINAFMLWITDKMIEGFEIKDFFNTIIAAVLITLADSFIHWLL